MKIILSRRSYRLPQIFSHADRHFRSLRIKAAKWKYTEVDDEFFLQEFFLVENLQRCFQCVEMSMT